MKKGSKSFSFAALFFASADREAARELYAWCRTCDDAIDSAPTPAEAATSAANLRALTERALAGEPTSDPAFAGLQRVCRTYGIPSVYPLELISGMANDASSEVRIQNEDELLLYCYRVAGCVGLMMSHIMGVSSPEALRHALHTGIAMQMTNIARDVREDFDMRRIYIPESWLSEQRFDRPFIASEFTDATERLLNLADIYYRSGARGLRYLPWRARLAVRSAQVIYREIGSLIATRGSGAWDHRAVVSLSRKVFLALNAVAENWRSGFATTHRCQLNLTLGPNDLATHALKTFDHQRNRVPDRISDLVAAQTEVGADIVPDLGIN